MKTVIFSDCTLRRAAEGRAHALLFREKVSMVKAIKTLGVDAVELPGVTNLREDTIVNKTIAAAVGQTALVLPAGESEEEIAGAYGTLKDAENPWLKISLPVSTVQMEYTYRLKAAGMLEKIGRLCAAAKALCKNVEFAALDATRAEPAFLLSAVKEAEKNGATAVTLCDDAGETLPEEWAKIVAGVRGEYRGLLFVRTNDRLGFASAGALAALCAGADGLKTCLESKEALTTEKAAEALFARGEGLGLATRIDRTAIHTDVQTLLKSLKQNSYTEERQSAGTVFLDGQSTLPQIAEAAFSLGYDLTEEDLGKVKESLAAICRKKDSVGQKEFEAIIASSAMQVPSTYHLESYTATSGNMTPAVSQVTLTRSGEKISGVASGDGPIDAAFLALESCVGYHYELDNFEIQSVTEGKEALGWALVRLRHDGKLYSGNGLSTDIVGASIRAYVNALNKIVYEG